MENSEKVVDNSPQDRYNSAKDDENVHVVKMDEQAPVNDTSCKHDTLVPNPNDTIGEAVYHGCANPKCGVGFYIQPLK